MVIRVCLAGYLVLIGFSIASAQADPAEEKGSEVGEERKFDQLHRAYFMTFDKNQDGILSGSELKELPRTLERKFVPNEDTNVKVTMEEFCNFLERIREFEIKDKQKRIREEELRDAEQEREKQFARYINSLTRDADAKSDEPQPDPKVIAETSPHKDYFRELDLDGNGTLQGDELNRLAPQMATAFSRRYPASWNKGEISLVEFHEYWEANRRDALLSRDKQRAEQRFANYWKHLAHSPQSDADDGESTVSESEAAPKPVVTETEVVEEISGETVSPPSSKAMAIDIVLLQRVVSPGLPIRPLSEEVEPLLDMEGASIPTRMVKWLEKSGHEEIRLADYLQANVMPNDQVEIQQGSSEPSPTVSSRGDVLYSLLNVGTQVRVIAVPGAHGTFIAEVGFEKSYIVPGKSPGKEKAEETEQAAEDPPESMSRGGGPPGGFGGRDPKEWGSSSAFARGAVIRSEPGFVPDTVATLTARGTVEIQRGKPAIVTEIGRMKGDQFEELLILVEWK